VTPEEFGVRGAGVAEWPPALVSLVRKVQAATPDDLPPAPWTFHAATIDQVAGGPGGDFVTVTNTERFLESLRFDVEQGPRGPRARTGALYKDLLKLATAIRRRKKETTS